MEVIFITEHAAEAQMWTNAWQKLRLGRLQPDDANHVLATELPECLVQINLARKEPSARAVQPQGRQKGGYGSGESGYGDGFCGEGCNIEQHEKDTGYGPHTGHKPGWNSDNCANLEKR